MLSPPPILSGGAHGHCHLNGCWVSYFVIWEARWQISGFVWFLGLLSPCAHASLKKIYKWQLGNCVTNHLQEWHSQMRRWCGDIQTWSVSENWQRQTWLDSWMVKVADGVHEWETHAECLLLRPWLQWNGKQHISIWTWWESILLCH